MNANGTITVAANTTETHTVPYHDLLDSRTEPRCDNATATVTVGTQADMRASTVVCTPDPATIWATVSCAVTCTQRGLGNGAGATCSVTNAASCRLWGDGGVSGTRRRRWM